jgi:hypothetical protein
MPLPGMDRPPLPTPDIQSQMGIAQEAPQGPRGLSAIAEKRAAPGPMGRPAEAPNPHGFLLARADALKQVLEEMASAEPIFAPFAQRAISVIETGVSAVSTTPQPGAQESPEGGLAAGGLPPTSGGTGPMPALG